MEYLKVWTNFRELLEPLTDAERGRLFVSMLEYAETGEVPCLTGSERYVWPSAKQSIDRTRQDALNASKGGSRRQPKPTEANRSQPKPTEANQSEPTATEANYKEKDKDNDKETLLTESKEKRTRFSPPSLEEVTAYCKERGNKINPQAFIDFYSSKGWKVGQTPMKDWKACIRTWEQRQSYGGSTPQKPKLLRSQDYKQREYHEEQLHDILGVDDVYAEGAS